MMNHYRVVTEKVGNDWTSSLKILCEKGSSMRSMGSTEKEAKENLLRGLANLSRGLNTAIDQLEKEIG